MKLKLALGMMTLCASVAAVATETPFDKMEKLFDTGRTPTREEVIQIIKTHTYCAAVAGLNGKPVAVTGARRQIWKESSGLGPEFPEVEKDAIMFHPSDDGAPDQYSENLDSQGLLVYSVASYTPDCDDCSTRTYTSNKLLRLTAKYLVFRGAKDSTSKDTYYGYCWK